MTNGCASCGKPSPEHLVTIGGEDIEFLCHDCMAMVDDIQGEA